MSEIALKTINTGFLVYFHTCNCKKDGWISLYQPEPCEVCKPEDQFQEVKGTVIIYLDKEGFVAARLPLRVR